MHKNFVGFFVAGVLATGAQAQYSSTPEQVQQYLQSMEKQKSDMSGGRQSEYLVLPNELRLMVISDPMATRSAVSVSVGAGLLNDPREYRGLAHYLEHMLFLGSKKYPDRAEHMAFVNAHQGMTNAFTAYDQTNYELSIPTPYFPEGLDRIAQFFIAPMFDPKYIDKELNQIQHEYEKNTQSFDFTAQYLSQMVYRDDHPIRWVFQGNRETLGHVPRQVMVDFYNRYYSANNIVATLVSPMPLADLKKLGVQVFSQLPNRKVALTQAPPVVNFRKEKASLFKVQTPQKAYRLALEFNMLPQDSDAWMTKNLSLLSGWIGDESPGSLAASLKAQGLILSLSADAGTYNYVQSLSLTLQLTKKGYAQWQNIASALLAYIEQVKKIGFVPELYKNSQRQSELAYLFSRSDEIQEAVRIATALRSYPADHVNERDLLIANSSPNTFAKDAGSLNLTNANVYVFAPDITADVTPDFYRVKYHRSDLDQETWATNPVPLSGVQASAPRANTYLPNNLGLISTMDVQPHPLTTAASLNISVQQTTEYKTPKSFAVLEYRMSKDLPRTPRAALLNMMLASYINTALQAPLYQGALAGYGGVWANTQLGFQVTLNGYSENFPHFANDYIKMIHDLKIDPMIFDRVVEKTMQDIDDLGVGDAFKQSVWLRRVALSADSITDRDLAHQIQSVSIAELENFLRLLLEKGEPRWLFYGNITDASAGPLADQLTATLGTKVIRDVRVPRLIKIPKGSSGYVSSRAGENNSWLSEFQLGSATIENIAKAEVLGTILSNPFYTYMRTERNFGYIVMGMPNRFDQVPKITLLVQSPEKNTVVADAGEKWIRDFATTLKATPAADFEDVKKGLATSLRLPATSIEEKVGSLATRMAYDRPFDFNLQLADAAEKVQFKDIADLYDSMMVGPERRQLNIYLDTTSDGGSPTLIPAGENRIDDLYQFRNQGETWP